MKAAWRAVLCGLLLFAGAQIAGAGERTRTSKDCDPNDRFYFPVEAPGSTVSGLDNFHCDWFSRHLRSMKEPSLQYRAADQSARAYRLLAVGANTQPFMMRLESLPEGRWRLVEKATDGRYIEAGEVVFEQTRMLTDEEAERLNAAFAALDLANTNTGEEPGTLVLGGLLTAIEIVQDGRYRAFTRYWNTDHEEPAFGRIFGIFDELSAWLPIQEAHFREIWGLSEEQRRQEEAGEQE